MAGFKIRDLMIHILPEDAIQRKGIAELNCRDTLRCLAVTLPNCVDISACAQGSLVGCGYSICEHVSLIADCDAGCTLGTCSDYCTHCSCSKCTDATNVSLKDCDIQLQNVLMLKAQLRQALAQLEAQERIIEDRLAPKSIADIDRLEANLNQALGTLREERSRIEGGEPPPR